MEKWNNYYGNNTLQLQRQLKDSETKSRKNQNKIAGKSQRELHEA